LLSPERWQIVERVFHEALSYPADERERFLDSSCAGDTEIRHEVESLLASESASAGRESLAARVAADWASEYGTSDLVGRDIGEYHVASMLGAGGMGEVYLAEDATLGRKVALKLLPLQFVADPGRVRRFTEEARAASALNHPNIITVHHIGEFEGRRYIATEFIDGETLRARIARGPLPPDAALDIALQAARALAAAHDADIVHRDIKPENIMIRRDGYVKVLDFGLAKLAPGELLSGVALAAGAGASRTRAGAVLGTLRYMAPEQAAGGGVDARADLFSLSIVLLEMLTGRIPDDAEAPEGMSGIPEQVAAILRRGLATDPDGRFASALEMSEALARARASLASMPTRTWRPLSVAGGAVAIVALLLVAGYLDVFGPGRETSATATPDATLAVLPFRTASLSAEDQYLGLSLADAIITQLGGLPGLRVRPTSAIRSLTDDADPVTTGRRLRAGSVLDGMIQRQGDRVRVTVNLLDVDTGTTRWSSRMDEPFSDLFALQDAVSQQVANALLDRMSATDQASLAARQTRDPEAYRLYLQGQYYLTKTSPEDLQRSLSYFKKAIGRDPRYARAHAGAASAYRVMGLSINTGADVTTMMPLARQEALAALAIDDALPEAHFVLGSVAFHYDWDWKRADESLTRALALSPNFAEGHRLYGWFLLAMRDYTGSITELTRAKELDPTSQLTSENLAWALDLAGRTEDALEELKTAAALNPAVARPHFRAMGIFERRRRFAEALQARKAGLVAAGNAAEADRVQQIYDAGGHIALFEDQARAFDASANPDCMGAAWANLFLDRRDTSLKFLERCYEEKNTAMPFLSAEGTFDSLRGDARYVALLQRVGVREPSAAR
jgi:serine/threonine protein kinase/TolB-like protein